MRAAHLQWIDKRRSNRNISPLRCGATAPGVETCVMKLCLLFFPYPCFFGLDRTPCLSRFALGLLSWFAYSSWSASRFPTRYCCIGCCCPTARRSHALRHNLFRISVSNPGTSTSCHYSMRQTLSRIAWMGIGYAPACSFHRWIRSEEFLHRRRARHRRGRSTLLATLRTSMEPLVFLVNFHMKTTAGKIVGTFFLRNILSFAVVGLTFIWKD